MAKKTRQPGEHSAALHDELAGRAHKLLLANPKLTVGLIASQLDSHVDDVAHVLETYAVGKDGPKHEGVGQGGGWVTADSLEG